MLKRTTEAVRLHFATHDCELLSEYTGAANKMNYICSCGEHSSISWNNFTKGKRCGYCKPRGQKQKKSLEEIKEIFSLRGCEFLDATYNGIHFSHNYKCKCGTIAKISYAGFFHQKQDCYFCGLKKNQGPNHHEWKPDREQHRQDKLFRAKCRKAVASSLKAFGRQKVGHTSDLIGYGPKQLQEYITKHPNWDNVKEGKWHLDHIFPIQAFIDFNVRDLKIINALDNLQPLNGSSNISKSDKYDKALFLEWLATKH